MKCFLSIIFSYVFSIGFSQDYFDIAKFTYTNTPPNNFSTSNGQTTVEEIGLELNFPIPINNKTILLTGLFSNRTRVKLDAKMSHTNLYVVGLNIGVNTIFNEQWSATFMNYSKLASDKITFSKKNLQAALLTLVTNKKRDDLKYNYGFYANTEKFGLLVVPIFGVYYVSPNKKFEVNLNLPIMADLNYKLRNNIWLGMKFDGLGTTYHINESIYSSSGAYVSKISNEIFGYLMFQLNNSLNINTKVGYAVRRNYEVYDANDKVKLTLGPFYFGDDRTRLNEGFENGVIFKVELLYRLHFD